MKKLLTLGLLGLTSLGICGFVNISGTHTTTHKVATSKVSNGGDRNVLEGNQINAIVANPSGGFLIAGNGGLVAEVDASGVQTKAPVAIPSQTDITAIAVLPDNQGFIVAGYNGQITKFDKNFNVTDNCSLGIGEYNCITHIAIDGSEGAIFLTNTGEIYFTPLVNVELNGYIEDWSDYIGNATTVAVDGSNDQQSGFIIGLENGAIHKLDNAGNASNFASSTENTEGVYQLLSDGNGGYFATGTQYAQHFNSSGQSIASLPLGIGGNMISTAIVSDGNNGVYITDGSDASVVDHLDGNFDVLDKVSPFFPNPMPSVQDATVYSLVEDGAGHFIAGGEDGYDSAN